MKTLPPWIICDNDLENQINVQTWSSSSLQATEDGNSDDEVCEETTGPSHSKATRMLEKLLIYFERQNDT